MHKRRPLLRAGAITALLLMAAPGAAQIVPSVPQSPLDNVLGRVGDMVPPVDGAPLERTLADARALARAQVARARDLVRRHPDRIALDADGNPARAGELIVMDADEALIAAAAAQGFRLIERVNLDDMGIAFARFAVPAGQSLRRAQTRLQRIAGRREVSADPLHFPSGTSFGAAPPPAASPQARRGARIGIVDGGVPAATPGLARQQGFATGGVRPHDHASGIASILTGGGGVRASASGARLYVADVYGGDPAGGSASAIGRALAWMAREKVPVVVVSLVGPPNPLLARIVAAARRLGTVVVAAVGNDGPAAPPAYPASYPGAIAVTGVDARGRPLIEAGRAKKLDYAAPGADLIALGADGHAQRVRGTSFAAPFVAARLSAHLDGGIDSAIRQLDREAKGGGRATGRGILCEDCATR